MGVGMCVSVCACVRFFEDFCWISLISFPLVKVHATLCSDFASLNNQFIHILLVCETLYPAGKTRTRLKASLCQYFLLCDPNFIHKTICKSSAPMNCGNVEIVQISHHYSATRIHFSFFR